MMIQYSIKIIFALAIFLGLLSACTEDYDMELKNANTEATLIVDGFITDQAGPYFLTLTLTADYFSNAINPGVGDASVVLNDGEKDIVYTPVIEFQGLYRSPDGFQGEVGRTYTLTVSDLDVNDDGIDEVYTAESYLADCVPIDDVTMDYKKEHGGKYWRVFLHALDNPETDDFYVFKVYENDTLISNYISEWSLVSDEFFKEGAKAHEPVYRISQEDKDGNVFDEAPILNDVYTLEMSSVPEDYLNYLEAIQEEMRPKVPLFSSPAANVPTNISNGAYGFFVAYSVRKGDVIITQDILDLKNK